jgi:hypothetical protein
MQDVRCALSTARGQPLVEPRDAAGKKPALVLKDPRKLGSEHHVVVDEKASRVRSS